VNRWLALTLFIGIAFAASAIGALTTTSSVTTWYPTIAKPSWNPPNWVFAPVWSMLYLFMAIAAWRVWLRRAESGAGSTIVLWFAQLFLNVVWSLLFFGAHNPVSSASTASPRCSGHHTLAGLPSPCGSTSRFGASTDSSLSAFFIS
jgi:tryptophan-rich sensory protein